MFLEFSSFFADLKNSAILRVKKCLSSCEIQSLLSPSTLLLCRVHFLSATLSWFFHLRTQVCQLLYLEPVKHLMKVTSKLYNSDTENTASFCYIFLFLGITSLLYFFPKLLLLLSYDLYCELLCYSCRILCLL